MALGAASIDGQRFRRVLGNYPTGVTVVTAIGDDGNPAGMAVGSFTSVSLDPPLVAFLPTKSSTSFPKIRTASSFCVNVLAADQEPLSRGFAARGGDKFAGVSWSRTPSGAPRLDGAAAWIDCEFESVQEAGDHYLVIGRVRHLDSDGERLPLVFFQGGYGRFSPASLVAVPEPDFISHLRLADLSRTELERVAAEVGTECLAIAAVDDQLVVLASAGTPSRGAEYTRVGQRMPFVPPIGAPFVAWADDDAVRAWLTRAGRPFTDAERERHLALLTRVRARGWSISLGGGETGSGTQGELLDAIDSYDEGEADGRERVQRLGVELAHRFEPEHELEPDAEYDVRLASVPVFGPDGAVVLTLTLWGLPHPCTGADVRRFLDIALAAAHTIGKSLDDRSG
ncbi:flavin reductase [Pseudonocardia acaciae]|uniref:flavin reductase n=1 Tax=Pseudonocardia acaciae TaxID=551276 RepID=UPI000490A0E4|nr:flavin reductase [Pseudonocardia acaciae]